MSNQEDLKPDTIYTNPDEHRRRLSPIEQELLLAQMKIAELEEKTKELEKENHELAEKATKDPLTGAWNRAGLEARLGAVDEEIRLHPEIFSSDAVYFIMIDVDDFKSVNDQYGHAAGDTVLKTLAATLTQSVREYDTVCRWGGEEFLIALIDGNITNAFNKAEDIRVAIEALDIKSSKDEPIAVTASFGVAAMGLDLETGQQAADSALYKAKEQGRNQVVGGSNLDSQN